LGKFLAAWITALAFLGAALPFLGVSFILGGAQWDTVVVTLLVLALELGVVAAIGVGLSGILRRPLFSIVVTYLLVALLSIGTLIGFSLGGLAAQSQGTSRYDYAVDYTEQPLECVEGDPQPITIPRFDRVWWILAANPYFVVADAAPTHYAAYNSPDDLFGWIKLGLRSAQQVPDLEQVYSDCDPMDYSEYSPRKVIDESVPGWFVGLGIHLLLAGAALWGAIALTHAPSRRLAAGSRIA
jgi:hypothetical protein